MKELFSLSLETRVQELSHLSAGREEKIGRLLMQTFHDLSNDTRCFISAKQTVFFLRRMRLLYTAQIPKATIRVFPRCPNDLSARALQPALFVHTLYRIARNSARRFSAIQNAGSSRKDILERLSLL